MADKTATELFGDLDIDPETGEMKEDLKADMEEFERDAAEQLQKSGQLPASRRELAEEAIVSGKATGKKKRTKKKVRRRQEPESPSNGKDAPIKVKTNVVIPPKGKVDRDNLPEQYKKRVRMAPKGAPTPFFFIKQEVTARSRPTYRNGDVIESLRETGCPTHGPVSFDIVFPNDHLGLPALFCKRCKQVFSVFDLDAMEVEEAKDAVRSLGVEVVD